MSKTDIEAIKLRRQAVLAEIDSLEGELKDLDTALRVLHSLFPISSETGTKSGPPRPEGIPTIFEMVTEFLNQAPDGLTYQQIVDAIRDKYWPGVKPRQITPSIYGYAKRGRIKKASPGRFCALSK